MTWAQLDTFPPAPAPAAPAPAPAPTPRKKRRPMTEGEKRWARIIREGTLERKRRAAAAAKAKVQP